MTKPQMLIVNLPFPGFYESWYSADVDREEEQFIEYRCRDGGDNDADYEPYWPQELRLTEEEYQNTLLDVTSYSAAYLAIAKDYVATFDFVAGEAFGLGIKDKRKRYNAETKTFEEESYVRPSIRATFESMDSPREYNFTTDRVYAHIPISIMRHLFKRSKDENHETLKAVIAERFTSRSGFISWYRNEVGDWLEKPLADWDHNELGTLLVAAMRQAGCDPEDSDTRFRLYEGTCGDEGSYRAWSNAVDWTKFEAKRSEMRAEKLVAWIDDDKESAMLWRAENRADFDSLVAAEPGLFGSFEDDGTLPYRCPETPDMFEALGR